MYSTACLTVNCTILSVLICFTGSSVECLATRNIAQAFEGPNGMYTLIHAIQQYNFYGFGIII